MADRNRYYYRRALLLLIFGLGCFAIYKTGLLYMLLRKRNEEAMVEEEEEQVSDESLLEKEGDQLISSADLETTEVAEEINDSSTDQDVALESNESKPQEIDGELDRRLFASEVLFSGS